MPRESFDSAQPREVRNRHIQNVDQTMLTSHWDQTSTCRTLGAQQFCLASLERPVLRHPKGNVERR